MRLTAEGIKGGRREMTLSKKNLLVGPNGSGKTAAPQAIKVAALGYDPALGKRPMDQSVIMEGEEMVVRLFLEDEDNRAIRRAISSGDKGYEGSAHVSWLPQSAKPGEHASAISKLFGRDADEIAQCLDISQLLKLTPNKRAATLEEMLGNSVEDPVVTARAIIHHALIHLVEIPEEKAPSGNREMMDMIAESQIPILQEAGDELVGKLKEHGIGEAIESFRIQKKLEDRSLRTLVGAEKALRKKLMSLPETQPEEIDRVKGELRTIEARITAEVTRGEERGKRANALKKATEAVAGFFERLCECQGDIAELRENYPDVEEDRAKLKEIVATLDSMPQPKVIDLVEVTEARKAAQALKDKAAAIEAVEIPSVVDQESRLQFVTANLESAEADPWRKVHTKAGAIMEWIRHWKDQAEGPPFGEPATWASEIHAIASDKAGEDLEALKEATDDAIDSLDAAKVERKSASEEAAACEIERGVLLSRAEELDGKADALLAAAEKAGAKDRKEIEKAGADLRAKRDGLEAKIDQYAGREKDLQAAAQAWTEKHKEAQGRVRGSGPTSTERDDVPELQTKATSLRAEVEGLEAAAGRRSALAEIVRDIQGVKDGSAVYGALLRGAERVRQKGVTEAGSGLTSIMATFLAAGGREDKPYIRANKKACEIGWRRASGKEIAIQAMSGGEWALFSAALSAAVIIARGAEIKILIVEAGEADQDRLSEILAGIAAVEEDLTAALVLTHVPIAFEVEGWAVHEFGLEEVSA